MRTTFYTLLIGLMVLLSHRASAQCPTVFCQDLNTSFMPDACMVEIWAKDFVSKVDMGMIPVDDYWVSFAEDSLVMNKIFRSEDGKKQDVSIWVAENPDGSGCKSRCDVVVTIRDNSGDCPERDFAVCPIEPNPWCGYAVLSCSAEAADEVVATILDVRRNDIAPRGDDWAAPNTGGDTLNVISPAAWRLGNLGQIFGMARRVETGEIFMAASDVYAFDYSQLVQGGFVSVGFPPPTATGSAGPAGIYRTMFGTDPNAITVNPIIFTNGNSYLEANEVIGGNFISNFGNFDGAVLDPVGLTNHFEQFDSMGTTSGNGLGNITYDRRSNHLFATNLEDGKIYSINCLTNTVTDVFDPFEAYSHAVDGPGIVKPSERVWAVAIRSCTGELYFARNTTSTATLDHLTVLPKTIHKVDIAPSGRFIQADGAQELVLNINDRGTQNKITDISFDITCNRMLLAERGHPHKARLFEYTDNGTSWTFGQQYYVGIYDDDAPVQPGMDIVGSSTGGGAAYGPSSSDSFIDAECDQVVWSTVHCGEAVNVPGRCDIYGLQGISADGNDTLTTNATDIFVGLEQDPGNSVLRLKNNLGDVDIFNCCCPEGPRNPVNRGTSAIAGRVLSPIGSSVVGVEVTATTQSMKRTTITDINGGYSFGDIPLNQEYMVQSSTSGDPLDGISTLDIVQMQRHILGVQTFDDNYKMLAGDVDGSGNVSASDLVRLRRMILGKSISDDQPWRLYSMSSMADDGQPLDYTIIDNLQTNLRNIDFVALKVGDVNYDNSRYLSAQGRSSESLSLIVKTQANGHTDFIASQDISTSGFQFALETKGAPLSITSQILDITTNNFEYQNGVIRISWNGNKSVKKGEVLFTLRTAERDEQVVLASREIMRPEIYSNNLEVAQLELIDNNTSSIDESLIVSPNPFSDLVNIQIHSEYQDNGTIHVIDHIGRVTIQKTINFTEGANKLSIDLSSQPTGVYIVKAVLNNKQLHTQVVKIE